MEKNVTSLEISKKLKEAGFKKGGRFFWSKSLTRKWEVCDNEISCKNINSDINCFQINTLLKELPRWINQYQLIISFDTKIMVFYGHKKKQLYLSRSKTLQDALAEMWLWLDDNGYIKGEK